MRSRTTLAVALIVVASLSARRAAAQDELFRLEGDHAGDSLGGAWSIAALGDVDGDGRPDFALAERRFDGTAGGDSGRVRVFSGATRSVLHEYEGEYGGDWFGQNVNDVGDLDGDGVDDLGVGALNYPNGARFGKVYVYSGATGAPLFDLVGENAGDIFCIHRGVGDATGDGVPDLLVSALLFDLQNGYGKGKVYLYSGADRSLVNSWIGETGSDFGFRLARLGFDADGDGLNDFAVGTLEQGMSPWGVGHVYVYSGASQTPLATFAGTNPGDLQGYVCDAADLDGDGTPDVLVGSPWANNLEGYVSAYSGRDWSLLRTWTGTPELHTGAAYRTIDDVDGDGCAEVVLEHSAYSTPGLDYRGAVSIRSGRTGRELARTYGEQASQSIGANAVADVGDLDGDGLGDLLVGSFGFDGAAGTDTGLLQAFRGDDLYVVLDPPAATAGDAVALTVTLGVPGNLGLLVATELDGTPLFVPLITAAAFDANGEIALGGTVPPGLGAHLLGVTAFAIGATGRLVHSSQVELALQ